MLMPRRIRALTHSMVETKRTIRIEMIDLVEIVRSVP